MPSLMPIDQNANPIPALRLKPQGAHMIAANSTTSARNAQGFSANVSVVSIYASAPVYLAFGDENITASAQDHYFPAGIYYDFAIGDDVSGRFSHVAVLSAEGDASVYLSEKI